jgi:hypothetical protein
MKAIQCYAYRIHNHMGAVELDRRGEPYGQAVFGSSWEWLDHDFTPHAGGGDALPLFELLPLPPGVSVEDATAGWIVSRTGNGL